MKRLIFIFLLAILPYQSSWAVAAAYCEHDATVASTHFGHHAHEVNADYHAQNQDDGWSKLHGDCSYCHAGAAQVCIFAPVMPPDLPVPRVYLDAPPTHFTSHVPATIRPPERLPVA